MLAPAKINLDLLITGRREDGYHLLDSIVIFTELGDELKAEKSDRLSLTISGPFAGSLKADENNLVLKAARLICEECNIEPRLKFHLVKNLPVSSGIGGGSADAAAALRLTLEKLQLQISPERLNDIALKLGADVPVCLKSAATHMRGIGEDLKEISIKDPFHLLLVNPGVTLSTPEIFEYYKKMEDKFDHFRNSKADYIHDRFIEETLIKSRNALEHTACRVEPKVLKVLKAFNNFEGLLLKRMSGSGATCFGVFDTKENCIKAQKILKHQYNNWWVKATGTI